MDKAKQKAIIFTGIAIILFYWCIGNLSTIGNWLQYVLGLVSPFILGGAIAFIVNVPMRNIEKKLFQGKSSKKMAKFRRPLAFLLTLLAAVVIITLLIVVVVPEIGKAFGDLIERVPKSYAIMMRELEKLLVEYPEIEEQVASIKIDWNSVIDNVIAFFSAGTKGLINSGIGVISGLVSGVTTTFIGFVFAIISIGRRERKSSSFM